MCVFGNLYYPKPTAAFDNRDPPSIVGTGKSTCSEIVACETACGTATAAVDTCREKCLISGCPRAAEEFRALGAFVQRECQTECAAQHCRECALVKCPTKTNTCRSQTCAP